MSSWNVRFFDGAEGVITAALTIASSRVVILSAEKNFSSTPTASMWKWPTPAQRRMCGIP